MKVPPPELLLQVSNDPSAENYGNVAPVRWAVEQPLIAAGYRLADFERILDFGCGVGRFLQAMHQVRRDGQQLYGCDVNAACANWCKANLDFANVEHTALDPPLPYADESFDLITAISVFTHLSRPLQVAWARELMRVLQPGGVALVTTVGLGLLPDVLRIYERWAVREYALLGATGTFLHFAIAPTSALEGQREVVAVHSSDAIAQIFSPMRIVRHVGISDLAGGQDTSIIVKPKTGCRVVAASSGTPAADCEVPANGTTSNTIALRFDPDYTGPAHFRAYVAMAERRYDLVHLAVECRMTDPRTGRLIALTQLAFPTSVALGPDHYIPFTVEFESAPSVEVSLALVLRRSPWQSAPIRFRWWDARIEIGSDRPNRAADRRARVDSSLAAEMFTTAEPPLARH
jgi:SAM-dependent methyltransferase